MAGFKLVCFDLDDTLIMDIHSVMLPCILNGKGKELSIIEEREVSGELDYIAADYLKASLLRGFAECKIADSFLEIAKPLKNISQVVDALHMEGIMCIVITVGPRQVSKVVCDMYGFDDYYGSNYEVVDGVFTGKILDYVNAEEKVECLIDFCNKHDIALDECIAVGDGMTDVPIFDLCGKSIALNATADLRQYATFVIETRDLVDVLQYIV